MKEENLFLCGQRWIELKMSFGGFLLFFGLVEAHGFEIVVRRVLQLHYI